MHLVRIGNRGVNLSQMVEWTYTSGILRLYFAGPDQDQPHAVFEESAAALLLAYLEANSVNVLEQAPRGLSAVRP